VSLRSVLLRRDARGLDDPSDLTSIRCQARLLRCSTGGTGTHSAGVANKNRSQSDRKNECERRKRTNPLFIFLSQMSALLLVIIYSIYLYPIKSKSLWLGMHMVLPGILYLCFTTGNHSYRGETPDALDYPKYYTIILVS
jgi:hypothetical protein